MNLLKYNDFLNENHIYELLLESKVVYSQQFINILRKMGDNKVSKELLKLYSTDIDGLNHNYIDVGDQKDRATFTQDRKAQELIGKSPQTWKVIDSQRYLTHSDRNSNLFKLLEYEKPSQVWTPGVGTLGLIKKEIISRVSGKVYVVFEEYDRDEPRKTVLNKQALVSSKADNKVWKHSRNPVNIGKLSRAILKSANFSFTDKDIEDFVNLYKATYDFIQDASKRFDIVKGSKIAKWYSKDYYESGGGTLNNSCMADVDSEYFEIYTYNKQVSLVILYDDNGKIIDGEYKSSIIKGRALLWECKLDGVDIIFMDRIYTTHDSDVELFKQFAEKNKWWYKKYQSMDPDETLTNGEQSKDGTLMVNLDSVSFDMYPYMDTLCYLNTDEEKASNTKDSGCDRIARDTEGDYEPVDHYYDDDDDY
jgi:hypothetical protein